MFYIMPAPERPEPAPRQDAAGGRLDPTEPLGANKTDAPRAPLSPTTRVVTGVSAGRPDSPMTPDAVTAGAMPRAGNFPDGARGRDAWVASQRAAAEARGEVAAFAPSAGEGGAPRAAAVPSEHGATPDGARHSIDAGSHDSMMIWASVPPGSVDADDKPIPTIPVILSDGTTEVFIPTNIRFSSDTPDERASK